MRVVSKRWGAPVLAVAAVAAVAVVPRALAASPHPALTPMSAAQLIAAAERSPVRAVTGTVETTANLGLPALPDRVTAGGAGFAALLTGTHRLRVWADGPDRQRLALLGDLAETDVVHDGGDVWLYDSATNAVTHWTGAGSAAGSTGSTAPDAPEQQLTPEAQARRALRAVDPTTKVRVDATAHVAGRSAYQLVITPRTSATLIRSVRIALDAATFAPLRVQVFAAGSSSPAWQTGFTDVSFRAPSASTFRFTPPAGATVTTHALPAHPAGGPAAHERSRMPAGQRPTTIGTGWASIVELPAGTADLGGAARGGPGGAAAMLPRLARPVAQGQLLSTRLLSVLVTYDGRVLAGAVPPAALERAAAAGG